MKIYSITLLAIIGFLSSCTEKNKTVEKQALTKERNNLPTIGLLAYEGVLMTEVTAPMDVFSKKDTAGNEVFRVVIIAETEEPIVTEEGLKIIPDYTFENAPNLDVLFVPSAYDMYTQVHNEKLLNFIKQQNGKTDYIVSNCGGAQLIGASGIADGKKIVTWIGGGEQLQKDYPNLIVQNDSLVSYVQDGKFSSSNGNLATYISSLELLEKLTSPAHRKFVESYLYMDRLRNWNK